MTRVVLMLLLSICVVSGALAAPNCHDRAAEKKLAGAALTSFVKKCEFDAMASCDKAAADKKYQAPPKRASRIECVKDAAGA